ncbi:MAG: hypothetical protein WAV72_08120, partial [Bradyrhizobium sp.]
PRRVPARSRVPAKNEPEQNSGNCLSNGSSTDQQGSDGGPLATLLAAVHGRMWRHDVRPPSDSGSQGTKKPAASFPARALLLFAMMKICR